MARGSIWPAYDCGVGYGLEGLESKSRELSDWKPTGDQPLAAMVGILFGLVFLAPQPAHGAGNHQLFIGADHTNGGATGCDGNYRVVGCVPGVVQFDTEELQPTAYTGSYFGSVLTDAAGKHQRLQPAQRSRERPDPFAGLVTKQLHGLGGSGIAGLPPDQIAHVGTGFGTPSRPDS